MELQNKTVMFFRIDSFRVFANIINERTNTLKEYLEDKPKAGERIEAVECKKLTQFPCSPFDIFCLADDYLSDHGYLPNNVECYSDVVDEEDYAKLQEVLDLIYQNNSERWLIKDERTLHTRITIQQEDIDYFNETKRLSERLREWLNQVRKSSQKNLVAE